MGVDIVRQTDTQPIGPARRPLPRWLRIGLVLIIGLGIVGGVSALAMLSFQLPDETLVEPYDLFSLPDRAEALDSSRDHLLWTPDERAWLYVPEGTGLGKGRLMISHRRLALVPYPEDPHRKVIYSIDLVVLRPDGTLDTEANSSKSLLLCYQLNGDEIRRQGAGEIDFRIEEYIRGPSQWHWKTVEAAPGWQSGQVCAAIHRLSLYALVGVAATPSPALSTPPGAEHKGDLYGLPGSSAGTATLEP